MKICPSCERTYEDDVTFCPADGEELVSAPDSIVDRLKGKVLDGRWIVGDLLGEGGMGAVFRGRQTRLDRPVAIKILKPEVAEHPKTIARFMREAKVLSALRHPHVVTILDFGRDEETGVLYLIMELLEGLPLNEWMKERSRLDTRSIAEIAVQVARALDEAHKREIVHRDLKPHNIFVSPVAGGVHVKVLDFGIAKVAEEAGGGGLTRTGEVQGTPHYMAPEQAQGMTVGPYTDLYALGTILFELISGEPPFDAPMAMAILLRHVDEPVPSLGERWKLKEAPNKEMVTLTESMLAKEPGERPASAHEVLVQLERLTSREMAAPDLAGLAQDGARRAAGGVDSKDPMYTMDYVKELRENEKRSSRNLVLLAAFLLALVAISGGVLYGLLNGAESPEEAEVGEKAAEVVSIEEEESEESAEVVKVEEVLEEEPAVEEDETPEEPVEVVETEEEAAPAAPAARPRNEAGTPRQPSIVEGGLEKARVLQEEAAEQIQEAREETSETMRRLQEEMDRLQRR